jgi:F0F1-type ATP synthase membrane subunit a
MKKTLFIVVLIVMLLTLFSLKSTKQGNLQASAKVTAYELFIEWNEKYNKSYREEEVENL